MSGVLDPCCDSRMMYFDKRAPSVTFCDNRSGISETLCDEFKRGRVMTASYEKQMGPIGRLGRSVGGASREFEKLEQSLKDTAVCGWREKSLAWVRKKRREQLGEMDEGGSR